MSARATLLPIALSLFVAACCCKPKLEDRVRNLEAENKRLRFEVDATEKANEAHRDYLAELSGNQPQPFFAIYYSENDLAQLARQSVPYRIPARSFNSKLQGTITVERVYDFKFLAGNKMTCKMDLRGRGIKYTGDVPDFAKGMVKDFIEGVESGVIADLDVTISLQGQRLKALAQATKTKLKKNSNDSNESRLRDEMNKRALKDPFDVDLRISGYTQRVERVVVTGNHLVVGYVP